MASSWATPKRWPTSRGRRSIEALLDEDTVEMPVQINGKLRGKITVPRPMPMQSHSEAAARADARIAELLGRQDGGQSRSSCLAGW